MSPRGALLAIATACAWLALTVAVVASGTGVVVALLAGLLALAVWHRLGRWASTVAPVACVVLLVGSTSLAAAALAGLLVLVHVVLVDLAADAHGERSSAVTEALSRLLPGFVWSAGALCVVLLAATFGRRVPTDWLVVGLLLSAPLLLLTAVLIALGLPTRRRFWRFLAVKPSRLSAVTRRYLAREGLRP
jgi:hypothetical protein